MSQIAQKLNPLSSFPPISLQPKPQLKPQHKTFLLGLSISFFFLIFFFAGALADRIFVIRPLDFVLQRSSNRSVSYGDVATELFSIPDIAASVTPSVVTLSIKSERRIVDSIEDLSGGGLFSQTVLDVPETIAEISQRPARFEAVQQDVGTGFAIDVKTIVTNKHVVSELSETYVIVDANDTEYQIETIYRDPELDIALITVAGNVAFTPLELADSQTLRVGEDVIAVGTALGEFRHTVTTGVVSGLGRGVAASSGRNLENLTDVIQTDAAINVGNSGGPLLNSRGQVIGVNVGISADAQKIGFAIPSNSLRVVLSRKNL